MNMIPSILTEKSISVSKYKLSSEYFKDFAFLFYGFELKTRYDEERCKIDDSLNPVKFTHLVKSSNGMKFKYFYGVLLKGNKTYNELSKKLAYASHKDQYTLSFENYKHMMSEYEIKTDNSYGKYSIGLYPFDNMSDMCDEPYDDYSKFFANHKIPVFQRVGGITPYIICDTANLIKQV